MSVFRPSNAVIPLTTLIARFLMKLIQIIFAISFIHCLFYLMLQIATYFDSLGQPIVQQSCSDACDPYFFSGSYTSCCQSDNCNYVQPSIPALTKVTSCYVRLQIKLTNILVQCQLFSNYFKERNNNRWKLEFCSNSMLVS